MRFPLAVVFIAFCLALVAMASACRRSSGAEPAGAASIETTPTSATESAADLQHDSSASPKSGDP